MMFGQWTPIVRLLLILTDIDIWFAQEINEIDKYGLKLSIIF